VSAPDQIAISASLESGAIASVFYRGGVSRGDNLRWEINGNRGRGHLEDANRRLKRLVADRALDVQLLKERPPQGFWRAGGISERRACRLLGLCRAP
jgi:hypothetical protein